MGIAFFGVMMRLLFERVEGLRWSEELEAVVRANAVCLVVGTGPPAWIGLGKSLSYAWMTMKVNVSCWLGSFFAWEAENVRRDALVVEMAMLFF